MGECEMKDFVKFLFSKTYNNNFDYLKNTKYINIAAEMTVEDVKYHYKEKTSGDIISNIKNNGNELAIFLYRLGNIVYRKIDNEDVWKNIHWIMRECCSCEIYFSSNIDIGFYVVHGLGTVLGPRHEIGKGFKIYQGCTVGQRNSTKDKCVIGDNVTLYSNSSILGSIKIGNNVEIGANSLVLRDIPSNDTVYGVVN